MGYNREELKNVIEGKGETNGIPMLYDLWIYPEVFEDPKEIETLLSEVPKAADSIFLNMPELVDTAGNRSSYTWIKKDMRQNSSRGMDSQVLLTDWEEADEMYRNFPDAGFEGMIPSYERDPEKYLLGRWWYCLFERHWSLRGMENALTDFLLYPEEVHTLYQKLTDFYMCAMERAHHELGCDGIFVSDDIGTQKGPFFSLNIFREFFKPYYKQMIQKAHELDMHFWLHSCGDIELFIPDFIEIGLDVLHPIQKNTMNEKEISKKYGSDICLLVGVDVQQIIPFGTPEDVRKEVRYLIDTYKRNEGRFMLTMGNGATKDWSVENIRALYEETMSYGGEGPFYSGLCSRAI